jgi:uncharacterized membrane protein YphA (DoxX/SURF4 family)
MYLHYKYSKLESAISWTAQLIVAVLLCLFLILKFDGTDEPVRIFVDMGVEPWLTYIIGTIELVTVILLVVPSYIWLGATATLLLMLTTVILHFVGLCICAHGDSECLIVWSIVGLIAGCTILAIRKNQIPFLNRNF